jgi:hypothetical protein
VQLDRDLLRTESQLQFGLHQLAQHEIEGQLGGFGPAGREVSPVLGQTRSILPRLTSLPAKCCGLLTELDMFYCSKRS